VIRQKAQVNTLAKDLQRWKMEQQLKLHRIHELDRQREKYAVELNQAQSRYDDACKELANRDNQMAHLKKCISEVKAQLGQQKTLFEAVKTDRNLYAKNHSESQVEISEMNNKFKVMGHAIEHLKEEIKEKDKAMVNEHMESEEIKKQTEKIEERKEILTKQQKKVTTGRGTAATGDQETGGYNS